MKQVRDDFVEKKTGSPKRKTRKTVTNPSAEQSNLPKVTKKELNLLKSLTEEEKESFKKQVEDDEAMLDGLSRKISDKTASLEIAGISRNDLVEIKAMNNPPELIKQIVCMIQVQFGIPPNDVTWANWKKMTANPGNLISQFAGYEKEGLDVLNLEVYKVISTFFKQYPDSGKNKSKAAASLYLWLQSVHAYQSTCIDQRIERQEIAERLQINRPLLDKL